MKKEKFGIYKKGGEEEEDKDSGGRRGWVAGERVEWNAGRAREESLAKGGWWKKDTESALGCGGWWGDGLLLNWIIGIA